MPACFPWSYFRMLNTSEFWYLTKKYNIFDSSTEIICKSDYT